jgi:hypothetical protein
VAAVDFGDAPDPTYATTRTSQGAGHIIVSGYHLGSGVDGEPDGQPHPFALGDDNDGTDDDNGVVFADTLFVGVANTVNVTASAPGMLDAWIDFNNDGDWNDAGEKVFVSVPLTAGVNALNFVVPATATATFATFARFRFSSGGGLAPSGIAPNGEVEDYFVPIRELDMGDAAASSFPTLLAENGPRHMLVDGYYLGSGVSAESDGQPDSVGVGDDGDDGVQFVDPLAPGQVATIEVSASAPGLLDGWVDFDNDGLVGVGEQVFVSVLLNSGANQLQFSVPSSVNVGDVVFARFRFSSVGGLAIGGFAPNGEVEDYAVAVSNGLLGDYNQNGRVDAADYTVWRNSLGANGLTAYSGADGSGDGMVDADDYGIWKLHFGETIPQGAGSGEQGVRVATALAEPVAHVAEDPHPLDNSRPLPEGEAINAALAARVAPSLYDGTALLAANILTSRSSAGASPSRWRMALVAGDSPHDDALVAWLSAAKVVGRDRSSEQIADGTCDASGTEAEGGSLECVDAVFELVGSEL